MKCPKCSSKNVETVEHNDISFVICKQCGYDESVYDVNSTQRSTQREKARYNPYKSGGAKRTK
ncbi:zf-TFIIB domain-containing protein [Candidatus Woesearchaeota archaeon]|nr:zf-TFIIB domain-containing protein [Candidatus Woesearchaeota archaeon]